MAREKLKNILTEIAAATDKSRCEAAVNSSLHYLLDVTGYRQGLIRIEYANGDYSIITSGSVRLPTFCFSGATTSGCACGKAMETGKVVTAERTEQQFCQRAGFKQVSIAPIRQGKMPAGFIFLAGDKKPTSMAEADLIAMQLGIMVAKMEEQFHMQRRLSTLETVSRVGAIISSRLSLEELTKSVVNHIGRVLKNDRVNLVLYDSREETLNFIASYESGGEGNQDVYPLSDGMNSWIVKNRRPLLISNGTIKECERLGIRHGGRPAKSWLGVPAEHGGNIVGILSVQSYEEEFLYDSSSAELLTLVAGQVAVAIENTKLYEATGKREQEKQKLYYSLTHDLLSLVNPISGFGDVLAMLDKEDFERRQQEISSSLKNAAGKISDYVEDILTFSKLQSGNLELQREEMDIYNIMGESITNFRAEMDMRKLDLYLEGELVKNGMPTLPEMVVHCDTIQMERVFNNCMQNALKHARTKVEVSTKRDGQRMICSIFDDGDGMPAELIPKIFEEYYQAESGKQGVGLGLPSVKRIVEMHGGEVSVDSDIGKGFKFNFSLPLSWSGAEK